MTGARADVPVRAVITPFHRQSERRAETGSRRARGRDCRPLLAWLGKLATFTLAWALALLILHLLGYPWHP